MDSTDIPVEVFQIICNNNPNVVLEPEKCTR